jgi:hypothetical protein
MGHVLGEPSVLHSVGLLSLASVGALEKGAFVLKVFLYRYRLSLLFSRRLILIGMPVQSAFTFLIIGGAFCAASALIGGLNYLYEGKRQRSIGNDHWRHHLQQRDWALEHVLKEKREKGI